MPQAAAQAKAAVFLLASRFGALDSKSMIPAVQELYQEREGGMQVDGKEPNVPLVSWASMNPSPRQNPACRSMEVSN